MVEETVVMPRKLTAENGAKAALMGEFVVKLPVRCECEDREDCPNCSGSGEYMTQVNVPWVTIKEIYDAAVKHFAATHTVEAASELATVLDTVLDTVAIAYGYLWHVNNEPGTPNQYAPERAAYEARKVLRELLTHEQRGIGINRARAERTNGQTQRAIDGKGRTRT